MDCPVILAPLSNGIRIALIQVPSTDLTTVSVHIKGGMDSECPQDYGMTHLVEHFVAKMTSTKYPCAKRISQWLGNMGIRRSAMTTDVDNVYSLSGQSKWAPDMVDVLLHAFSEFEPDPSMLQSEIHAVQEELKSIMDQPSYPVEYTLNSLLFPNSQKAIHLSDMIEKVSRATLQDVIEFRARIHASANILVLLATSRDQLHSLWRQAVDILSHIPASIYRFQPSSSLLLSVPRIAGIKQIKLPSSGSFLYFGIPLNMTLWDRRKYAVEALSMILTRGHSSRIMEQLRARSALIYQAGSRVDLHAYEPSQSVFFIETSTSFQNIAKALELILGILQSLVYHGITDLEMERYYNHVDTKYAEYKADLAPDRYVSDYALQIQWLNCVETNRKKWKEARSTTRADVDALSSTLFRPDNLFIVTGIGIDTS